MATAPEQEISGTDRPLRILVLEDDPFDVVVLKRTLWQQLPAVTLQHVESRDAFVDSLTNGDYDVILSDGGVPGCEGVSAFLLAREHSPAIPFIYVSGFDQPGRDIPGLRGLGVSAFVSKADLSGLGETIRSAVRDRESAGAGKPQLMSAYERLVGVVRELSLARDLPTIMATVRRAARQLTGSQGATFVLREENQCYYADEDAIGPLWKGRRFPIDICISGWAMMNRQPAVVEDIFHDPRIPLSAYEPTFVRSVVMVPIRAADPIGAIGAYWSTRRSPEPDEVRLLQALADTTAVAMENARIYQELESRVRDRTSELETFTYAVSHDLRAPVRHVKAFASILEEDHGSELTEPARHIIHRITTAAGHMGDMIEGLLGLAQMNRLPVSRQRVDLAEMARGLAVDFAFGQQGRVEFRTPDRLVVNGDPALLRNVLQNLLGNAWKFSSKRDAPVVELGVRMDPGQAAAYYVRDNGVGFDPAYAARLFTVFQRLHAEDEFPGTGVGLATVQRIIQKHGGRIWAESQPGKGATFYFTLGEEASTPSH